MHRSLFIYSGFVSHTYVSFHMHRSLFIYLGFVSHTYVSFHMHRSLFIHVLLFAHIDRGSSVKVKHLFVRELSNIV